MKTLAKWVFAAVVCAVAVGSADAQGQGQGRGQGRGQFGGGFGFGGAGPLQLCVNEDVLKDINATDEQKTKLKDWVAEAQPKQREKLQEKLQDVPMEERFQKMAAIQAELNKELWKDVEKVLKPEQYTRVKQIAVQAMGIRAFTDKDTVEKLKLNDEQKEKIKTITDENQQEQAKLGQEMFQGGGFDQEKMQEFQKKQAELTKKAFDKAKEVLKDDQKKAWADLTGKEFDVAKLRPAFGRRGGGL